MSTFPEIYLTALRSAALASEEIMRIYLDGFEATLKDDGSPVTQADLASSRIIHQILSETNIPVTGEEVSHEAFDLRRGWALSWCVDPLDGTKEFVKRNGEFCINIALINQHVPVFGLIASPVQDKVLFGGKETGVYFAKLSSFHDPNLWIKVEPSNGINQPLVMASSRSHHSGSDLQFVHQLRSNFENVDFLRMGSALKFFDLAQGTADVYPRFAPTMEWDIAAGQAILEALGGSVVHAETAEPLLYNKSNLKNPYFIAKTKAYVEWENR